MQPESKSLIYVRAELTALASRISEVLQVLNTAPELPMLDTNTLLSPSEKYYTSKVLRDMYPTKTTRDLYHAGLISKKAIVIRKNGKTYRVYTNLNYSNVLPALT